MIPLLMLAAGVIGQSIAKDQSVKAQKKAVNKEKAKQAEFQTQVGNQVAKEAEAWGANRRIAQDQAGADRVIASGNDSTNDAVQLFEGAAGPNSGSSAAALSSSANKRGAAYGQLQGGKLGINERRRLGLDIGANIAGIRQRARSSLSLFPAELERASQKGKDLNTLSSLVGAYGYGQSANWLGNMAGYNASNDYADEMGDQRTAEHPGWSGF